MFFIYQEQGPEDLYEDNEELYWEIMDRVQHGRKYKDGEEKGLPDGEQAPVKGYLRHIKKIIGQTSSEFFNTERNTETEKNKDFQVESKSLSKRLFLLKFYFLSTQNKNRS